MQNATKILTGVGLIVGVVGAGILVGWWGSRDHSAPVSTRPVEVPMLTAATQSPAVVKLPRPVTGIITGPTTAASTTTNTSATASSNTNLIAGWEDKLDDVLGSEEDDTNKVKQLFEMFPRLPEEGQAEVANHLSNLVPDNNYSPLGQLLQNAKLPDSVLDALMSDVLNRPNSVKLPQLLQVAQNPDHPKADEAKDLLELYLDEEDPAKWPQKMTDWLKENPD